MTSAEPIPSNAGSPAPPSPGSSAAPATSAVVATPTSAVPTSSLPTSTQPTSTVPTSTVPTGTQAVPRPAAAGDAALFDAVACEFGIIYGYGLVSAHSTPDVNDLVSNALAEHRERREAAIAMLTARSVAAPQPAAGYQLPMAVDNPTDAANLALHMEQDSAVAWRAVIEQATNGEDRAFGVTALSQSAVEAARWSQVLGVSPITVAFPGGNE
jgi:hypothetical protein